MNGSIGDLADDTAALSNGSIDDWLGCSMHGSFGVWVVVSVAYLASGSLKIWTGVSMAVAWNCSKGGSKSGLNY